MPIFFLFESLLDQIIVYGDTVIKKSACSAGAAGAKGSIAGSGGSPGEGKWQATPVFLPGKSHGERSPVGKSP